VKLETAPGRTPIHVSTAGAAVITISRQVGSRSVKIALSSEEALHIADALVDCHERLTAKAAATVRTPQ
jgi:hypothetical protein